MISDFLKREYCPQKPILLALSGGPDSLALFYMLSEKKINLHIAHVDHGWRSESAEEVRILEELARKFNVPFYLKKLSDLPSRNLEDYCRQERIKFFEELYAKNNYQALVLGHHLDDLAETVLKRLLEGSSFKNVLAMEEVSTMGFMTIWRPLLKCRKRDLLNWLEKQNLQAFIDPTNMSEKYLRGRMRTTIMPLLCETFGKEVSMPLVRLATELKEVDVYIEEKSGIYWKNLKESPSSLCLDFGPVKNHLEKKHLLRKMAKKRGILLTYPVIEEILKTLEKRKTTEFKYQGYNFSVERGKISIISGVERE